MGHGVAAAGGQWTVGDVRLFTSPIYRLFAKGAGPGIYKNRWADQLIFAAAVILLGNKQFCFHPMFQDAELFVHKKQGYADRGLWEKCYAVDGGETNAAGVAGEDGAVNTVAAAVDRMLESYPRGSRSGREGEARSDESVLPSRAEL
eukprot:g7004.t1